MAKDYEAFRHDLVSLLPRLRRFAITLAEGQEAAEDLLQSAAERALRRWKAFDDANQLDAWMFKAMQNIRRETRRYAADHPTAPIDGLEFTGVDGREVIGWRQDLQLALEAFRALPEEQRAVIALVVLEGFSYAETAEALAMPIGTVMSRLSRARGAIVSRVRGNEHVHS